MSEEYPAVVEAELSAARCALAARLLHHEDEPAHALLACLYLLAKLHDRPAEDGADAVALSHPLACTGEPAGAARLITFTAGAEDRALPLHPHTWDSIPSPPTGPLLEEAGRLPGVPCSTTRHRVHEFLDHLEELLRDVIVTADTQGYVDANANEAACLRAATRISRAAPLVATAY